MDLMINTICRPADGYIVLIAIAIGCIALGAVVGHFVTRKQITGKFLGRMDYWG